MPARHQTDTYLGGKNYRVIQQGISGESKGFNLLGIPIVTPTYTEALNIIRSRTDLTKNSRALANVTQDEMSLNFIIVSYPSIVVSADVVEFTD